MQGYCGHSTGDSTDNAGHLFGWISAGGFLVFTGEMVGVGRADPNIAAGESCNPPSGALLFTVMVAVLRQNCTVVPHTLTETLVGTVDLLAPLGDIAVHIQAHACLGRPLLL